MTDDDRPILHTIKYSPGTLTRSDRALARYLEMVRKYPARASVGRFHQIIRSPTIQSGENRWRTSVRCNISTRRPKSSSGFVALVQTGKTLHLSGIVAIDEALNVVAPGDMVGQIERVYDIMEKTLAKSGATLQHVVNETDFRHRSAQFGPAASAARAKRYASCTPPATTAVQVSRAVLSRPR